MKKTIFAAAVLLAGTALTSPASAITFTPADVGSSTVVQFGGVIDETSVPDLRARITYHLDSFVDATNTWNFSYTLLNNSTGTITASRITAFGFNTNPNLDQANTTVTGTVLDEVKFNTAISGGQFVEFCATTNNCTGGGGDGVLINGSTVGFFSLDFANNAPNSFDLDGQVVRFQSISGSLLGTSGTGVPVPGPIVGAGIPGLIAACGGLWGFNFWRRRRIA